MKRILNLNHNQNPFTMPKISKMMANEIALAMTAKKKTLIESQREQIREQVAEKVMGLVPDKVLQTAKEHPSFFRYPSNITVHLGPKRHDYTISVTNSKPWADGGSCHLDTPEGEKWAHELGVLYTRERKLCEERERLEALILSYGTSQRLQEHFPEAYAHYRGPVASTLPAINRDELLAAIEAI